MDSVTYLEPLTHQGQPLFTEQAITRAVSQVLQETLGDFLDDLMDYGSPYLGSQTVIERFMKQDGLFVLRRTGSASWLMRVIYQNWLAMGSERGLGFLEFALQMLWPDQWQVKRLWHSIANASAYPAWLVEDEAPNRFLSSRIRIQLDTSVNMQELSELSPVLRRIVPVQVVPQVTVAFDTIEDAGMGIGLAGVRYQVGSFSPF